MYVERKEDERSTDGFKSVTRLQTISCSEGQFDRLAFSMNF